MGVEGKPASGSSDAPELLRARAKPKEEHNGQVYEEDGDDGSDPDESLIAESRWPLVEQNRPSSPLRARPLICP